MKIKYRTITEVVKQVMHDFNPKAYIALSHSEGDYQGTTMYLINLSGAYGVVWYNYGSCALCDAFQSYHEGAYDDDYKPKEDQDTVWKPLEEGFRIELDNIVWMSPSLFKSNYHLEFSRSEEKFKEECDKYFRSKYGT